MLLPNKKQQTKLFQYANAARFAYNWAVAREKENYNNGNPFLNDGMLRKEFTQLKHTKFQWLEQVDCDVTKQAMKDACTAYKRFFQGLAKHPRFKKKCKSKPSFYQDTVKIKITETHVKLTGLAGSKRKNRQKLNHVKFAEKKYVPVGVKYYNPRISYDGLHWWLSVGIEITPTEKPTTVDLQNSIGTDVGIKELAVLSNGDVYPNINKTKKVRNIKKRIRRLQRSVSRKYLKNKKGERYCKTSNIIKSENELLKLQKRLHKRLHNMRYHDLHQKSSTMIKQKPSFICMEDLNVKGMLKNRHLAKAIQEQLLSEFHNLVKYKAEWSGIWFIEADRYFPSSKMCCICKNIKRDLKLKDRIYRCGCGNVIDRDYQAAINLRDYGADQLESMFA